MLHVDEAEGAGNAGSSEVPTLAGGVLTLSTDVTSEFMSYDMQGSPLLANTAELPPTVVVEARMRYVSDGPRSDRSGSMISIQLADATLTNTFFVADGEMFLLAGPGLSKGAGYSAPTADDFHNYRLEVDTDTRAMRVYYDGMLVITASAWTGISATPRILFGDSTSGDYGVSEWMRVTHNALGPNPCP